MTQPCCSHERDVLDLVAMGQWPQRADAQLRAHVAECTECAEVAAIAGAVREWGETGPVTPGTDHAAFAHVPDASVVWHRAQVRAREAAARTASRPVWVAQAAALAALVVALVWFGPPADWYGSMWSGVKTAVPTMSMSLPSAPAVAPATAAGTGASGMTGLMATISPMMLAAAGALALLASVAFAGLRTSEDR